MYNSRGSYLAQSFSYTADESNDGALGDNAICLHVFLILRINLHVLTEPIMQ